MASLSAFVGALVANNGQRFGENQFGTRNVLGSPAFRRVAFKQVARAFDERAEAISHEASLFRIEGGTLGHDQKT